ncbi:hypothetical protein HMPREF9004_1154 [Schaalia cardiffensis F0333]|uniref:Type VII secretion protein EccB n=1 Tax=Schaalia cardiffensis F0333 TaxID=888050 RepID=N6XAF2_9ACTO|nr:type VII secretion protein EccB [Schaalia cardiffensis]ENO18123.1 hypothetical protein HMPREF9004_1154 [Schaalia cardiffensis F0333]
MPSNKDILEAQRFNRRRLIAAFSSGTPGGKEVDAPNNLRPLLVGAVIAALILIVAAVMGRFSPTLPQGWENSTMIVIKSSGARYYTIDGTLRPVTNITSARLLSEAGSYKTSRVSASTIEGLPRGSQVGITGIPDDIPSSSALHSDEWMSCALEGGTHTWVAGKPEGTSNAGLVLVTSANRQYLISGGTRYLLDTTGTLGPARSLGLDQVTPIEVEAAWLDLFVKGSDLAPLSIDDAGQPATNMPERLKSARIGTIIEVRDEAKEKSPSRAYIVTGDGRIASLSSVARRMYELSDAYQKAGNPLSATIADIQDLGGNETFGPADWPSTINIDEVVNTDSVPCANLVLSATGARTELLSMNAREARRAASGAASTTNASATEVPTGSQIEGKTGSQTEGKTEPLSSVTVRGGSGALVRASSGGTLGATMFISDIGRAHGLGENPADAIARLSWTDKDVVSVPSAWMKLVEPGEDMTAEAVWTTVGVQ